VNHDTDVGAYCTPPQPGSSIGTDPNWDVNQINSMQHAWIFKAMAATFLADTEDPTELST